MSSKLRISAAVVLTTSFVALLVANRPAYRTPTTPVSSSNTSIVFNAPGASSPDYDAMGTFATEKLRVTGTGSDSISAAGGMQIVGPVQISGLAGSASLIVASTDQDSIVVTRTASALTDPDAGAIYSTQTGTYDTTAQQLFSYGVRGASQGSRSAGANALNNYGVFGFARNAQTNVGVVGQAVNSGIGVANEDVGVLGVSDSIGTTAYAVRGLARGGATTNYGVYGTATNGGTNYSGYFEDGLFHVEGAATFDSTVLAIGNLDVGPGLGAKTTILASDGSLSIGNPTVVTIDGTTGNITMNSGNLTLPGNITVNTNRFTVAGTTGNTTVLGTLTADGGLRVFDVAGSGLASSNNEVSMALCGANQVPQMDAGGTAWGCGTTSSGTITGSGTANTMAKFTGASAIGNSTITDNGTTVAIDTTKLTVDVATGNTTVLGTLTADGGNRVFDVAGAGMTSSANTVNVIAAANGGITVNADSVQMTFCAANQVPQMNAGGTQWGCGTLSSGTIGGSITASGVVYASGANTAATDETAFQYYAPGDILNIGSTAVTNCGGGGCSGITLAASSGTSGAIPVYSWNTNTAGYSGYAWNNSSSTAQGSIGFGNSAVGITAYRNLNFLSSASADYIFGESTTGTVIVRIGMTAGSAFQQWQNGSSAAVGAGSTGKLIYNSTTNTFRASLNGGAYTDVITGAVAANTIPKSGNSTTGALTASTLTDDGTTVITTAAMNAAYLGGNVAGSSPTVSGCGTSPTNPAASDTNVMGNFTTGTSGVTSSCTLNFAGTWPTAPKCVAFGIDSTGTYFGAQRSFGACTTTSCSWTNLYTSTASYTYICMN